jgi:microcystin-dependent protein
MADYNVRFTDNVNKGSITVEENSINTDDTSLQLPGQNLANYGQVVNENFLHLLESFANNTSPSNPVEGQLWYDTTAGVDQLKVYDGTNWVSAGGIKKANSEPEAAVSTIGDLWVDTNNQQVYLYSGSGWILVGPDYAEGASTGSKIDSIEATDDEIYTVLINYVNSKIVSLYSSQEFTPKAKQDGFPTGYTIKPGVNLPTQANFDNAKAKYYGTSEKSEVLVNTAGTDTINFEEVARLNKTNDFTKKTRFKTDSGVTIGENDLLQLTVSGSTSVIRQLSADGNIDIKVNDSGINTTAMRITPQGRVGISNESPEETLDVKGAIKATVVDGETDSGKVFVTSTVNSIASTDGALVVSGALDVAGNVEAQSILPKTSATSNIGSASLTYNNIYATTFNGALVGNVTGNVSGSAQTASKLTSPTVFRFNTTGDVRGSQTSENEITFDGQVGGLTKEWKLSINPAFVGNQTELTTVNSTADEFLVNRAGVLYKMTHETITQTIASPTRNDDLQAPLVPRGSIMPYAGVIAPPGWLFCHGQEINRTTYTGLYQVIGTLYGTPSNTEVFKVPDFRGRFLAGHMADATAETTRIDPDAGANVAIETVGLSAGRNSTTITLDNLPDHTHTLQGSADTQYFATTSVTGGTDEGATNNSLTGSAPGTSIDRTGAMNDVVNDAFVHVPPFTTIEYIIYTGYYG